jgi:hypothetical protein
MLAVWLKNGMGFQEHLAATSGLAEKQSQSEPAEK